MSCIYLNFSFHVEFCKQEHDLWLQIFAWRNLTSQPFNLKPKVWLMSDDTFILWSHGEETFDLFLEHLNGQYADIKFIMEMKSYNYFPCIWIWVWNSLLHRVFALVSIYRWSWIMSVVVFKRMIFKDICSAKW